MASPIMVPVDLNHTDGLDKSIRMAVEIANAHNAPITVVGVTEGAPNLVAANETEYTKALDAYAAELSDKHRLPVSAKAVHSVDVPAELGDVLVGAAEEMGAEAVVMASHVPGFLEHIFSSNAGYVASHAKCSVFVVR